MPLIACIYLRDKQIKSSLPAPVVSAKSSIALVLCSISDSVVTLPSSCEVTSSTTATGVTVSTSACAVKCLQWTTMAIKATLYTKKTCHHTLFKNWADVICFIKFWLIRAIPSEIQEQALRLLRPKYSICRMTYLRGPVLHWVFLRH